MSIDTHQLSTVPRDERHFYEPEDAFGKFGMRSFHPTPMPAPHWHGHVEFNLITHGTMTYDHNGRVLEIPENRIVAFWAGVPHYLTDVQANSETPINLTNLYVPVDSFLFMPNISAFQVALLGGGVVMLPKGIIENKTFFQWLEDYRSGELERREILRMELNAALRRSLLTELEYLDSPKSDAGPIRPASKNQVPKLVEMLRFILENLSKPLSIQDVAKVVDLHPNYASNLFTKTLHMPMKRFIIRMRLLRARAMLWEGSAAISTVAENSGFSSMTQFYDHFKAAYGQSPHQFRKGRFES